MEEIEVPLENVQEQVHESHRQGSRLSTVGALIAAILAVFAAVSALMASQHANEAMMEQIQAANKWSYYQAKSIKASILEGRKDVFDAVGKAAPEAYEAKLAEYHDQQTQIQNEARETERSSVKHLELHETFARAVTFFQVAIALTAVALLAHRKRLIFAAIVLGLVGIGFLLQASWESRVLTKPPEKSELPG